MNTVVSFVVFLVIIVQIQAASNKELYNEPVRSFVANGSISEYFPYMVSIRLESEEAGDDGVGYGFGHFCGGVLITTSHVLTLGSCIDRTIDGIETIYRPDELNLVFGSNLRYFLNESFTESPSKITVHPEYDFPDLLNNVAIIHLANPVKTTLNTVNPVSISNITVEINTTCHIMGWGKPFSNDGFKELVKGRVNVVNMSLCYDIVNRVCAGPDHIRGCPGDDGGPLICNDKLYGLIDFKTDDHCEIDSLERYENYINVADYYDWIMDVIGPTTNATTTIAPELTTNATTTIAPELTTNATTTIAPELTTNATTTEILTTTTNATTTSTTTTTTTTTTTNKTNDAVQTVKSVLLLTLTVILPRFFN